MTFDQLRDRVRELISLGGWSNATPPPNYAFLVNEGLRQFSRISQHNVEEGTITTVANQAAYSLLTEDDTREWIDVFDDVLYSSNTPAMSNAWLSQTTRSKLRMDNRLWRATSTGTPFWWYWYGPQQIGLFPVPSLSDVVISFTGPRYEVELVEDSDKPMIDTAYHDGIALIGAAYYGKAFTRGEENAVCKEYMAEGEAIASRYSEATAIREAQLIQRRVGRNRQEYMNLGSKQSPLYMP